jgi:hypothetical protein
MRKKQNSKQKHWKTHSQIISKGIVHIPLLIISVIVVLVFITGFLLSQNSIFHFNALVTELSPTPTMIMKSKCSTLVQSITPIPEDNAIAWLEMPGKIKLGTTVPLILRVKNISNKVIKLEREYLKGYPLSHSFRVTTLDGNEIWYWEQPESNLQFRLYGKDLLPGETDLITGDWQQVDNAGNPVPPGNYLIEGTVSGFKTCPMTLNIANR